MLCFNHAGTYSSRFYFKLPPEVFATRGSTLPLSPPCPPFALSRVYSVSSSPSSSPRPLFAFVFFLPILQMRHNDVEAKPSILLFVLRSKVSQFCPLPDPLFRYNWRLFLSYFLPFSPLLPCYSFHDNFFVLASIDAHSPSDVLSFPVSPNATIQGLS